ncbi:MAG: response regulator transcription factor [Proteobacteria bacterium]|nr:MAG: response regulator transcription factor [Pseudomonadota bacterium]
MAPRQILLVEDEPHLAFNMELNLREEGYEVVLATDGEEALTLYAQKGPFSLIILDVMLPGKNGLEVAQEIRSHDKTTGILMLTARAAESDILIGLEKGADDYMTKPFSLQELLLRVKRMADRSELFKPRSSSAEKEKTEKIRFADVIWDPKTFELTSRQGHFVLTALEAKVLREFLLHPGDVLSRQHLLSQVWGLSGNVETRTVDNFIMRLRKFFEADPSKPQILQSMRGRGYKFCATIEKVED